MKPSLFVFLFNFIVVSLFFTDFSPARASCKLLFEEEDTVNDSSWLQYYSRGDQIRSKEVIVETFQSEGGNPRHTTLLVQEFKNSNGTLTRVSQPYLHQGPAPKNTTGNTDAWFERFRPLVEKANLKFEERR